MTASDVDHKIVFNPCGSKKPNANANHGKHQRRNALDLLHSRSRSEAGEFDMPLLILSLPNETGITLDRTNPSTGVPADWRFFFRPFLSLLLIAPAEVRCNEG
jgi:hypothetical protein